MRTSTRKDYIASPAALPNSLRKRIGPPAALRAQPLAWAQAWPALAKPPLRPGGAKGLPLLLLLRLQQTILPRPYATPLSYSRRCAASPEGRKPRQPRCCCCCQDGLWPQPPTSPLPPPETAQGQASAPLLPLKETVGRGRYAVAACGGVCACPTARRRTRRAKREGVRL